MITADRSKMALTVQRKVVQTEVKNLESYAEEAGIYSVGTEQQLIILEQ